MALIDFSKAKITMHVNEKNGDATLQSAFGLAGANMGSRILENYGYDVDDRPDTPGDARKINQNETVKDYATNGLHVFTFSGSMAQGGNAFVIQSNNGYAGWRVSNITFHKDDCYVFSIVLRAPVGAQKVQS